MVEQRSREGGLGLERLCGDPSADWLWSTATESGVELLAAQLCEAAYHRHRHDTYAICLTTGGIQAFNYRGAAERSTPGQVVVLHPDELHDGRAGTDAGFSYRLLYVEPAAICEAARVLCGRPCALPFVRTAVATNAKLSAAIASAFRSARDPLALDAVVLRLAEGLVEADPSCKGLTRPRRVDVAAVDRARQYLDAEKTRVVRSAELEAVTGLTRYDLARQFRAVCGTSPYRYLLMRRLGAAREQVARRVPLVEVAFAAGFADQAHFTRMFKAAFGLTPARYGALRAR